MTTTTTHPIVALHTALAARLLGREREAALIVIALIAREHALLVGPPGTGKSALARSSSTLIDRARYCERLLSPTTPPEAIWGPISLAALRNDEYRHVTTGYAADAHVLYLDEVGRASAAILDNLLHLLGPERQALIGTVQVAAPLIAAIGSANTWPEDAAMLDRWTLRATVQPLGAGMRRALLTWTPPPIGSPVITLDQLADAHKRAMALPVSAAAYDTLDQILADLDEAGITVSDRRLRAAERIARAACVMRDGNEVAPIDLEPLQHVLWTTPEQAAVAGTKVVLRANPLGARLDAMLGEVDEVIRGATDAPKRLEAAAKLDTLFAEAKQLASDPSANGRAKKVLAYVQRQHVQLKGAILGMSAEQIAKLTS